MDFIEEFTRHYPESSIIPLMKRTSLNLLNGCKAIGQETEALDEKVRQLVDAGWGGVRQTTYFRRGKYDSLPEDEVIRQYTIDLLSDDYQPSKTENDLLVADAMVLCRFFMLCEQTDPLPMHLIARAFASAGVLMKEMMRAVEISRSMNADATAAVRAVDKHKKNRQPTIDAFYLVADRSTKKPHQIVNEIHEKTGIDKKKIRRDLTLDGRLHFKGYK